MTARRTKEQIVAELDGKIAFHQDCIDKLNERKAAVLNPKPRVTMKQIAEAMKDKGLSSDDLLKMISKAKPQQ